MLSSKLHMLHGDTQAVRAGDRSHVLHMEVLIGNDICNCQLSWTISIHYYNTQRPGRPALSLQTRRYWNARARGMESKVHPETEH